MAGSRKIAVGVYVGGKGLSCAAIDLKTKSLIPGTYAEGKVSKDAADRHILSLWSMLIKKSLKEVSEDQLEGIGFSIPGPFNYVNGIADYRGLPKYEELRDCNVTEGLNKRLMLNNPVEIRYINDAIGFAIGEEWLSPTTLQKGLAIIIGDGFGSGFLVDQLPVISGNTVPDKGAVYHLPFRDGIADDYFSIRGLLEKFSEKSFPNIQNLTISAQEGFKGKEVFENFGKTLGEFLLPIIKKFGPSYISFGGDVGIHLGLFKDSLSKVLDTEGLHITLRLPTAGESTFIYGGARLFDAGYWPKVKPFLSEMD